MAVDAVVGHAGERDTHVLAHRLGGQRDLEFGGDETGVIVERLVEIAQPEEEDRVRIALLEVQVLQADRRGHAARLHAAGDGAF